MTPERTQILQDIEKSVCDDFRMAPIVLKSDRRGGDITDARTLFSLRARALKFSYPEIGRWLNKDHSSIQYLVKKVGGR